MTENLKIEALAEVVLHRVLARCIPGDSAEESQLRNDVRHAFEVDFNRALAALDAPEQNPVCDACQRQVERVRGSMWHGEDRICPECFETWYDPGSGEVDQTSRLSIGNHVRKKHGLSPLPAPENP